MPATLVIVCGLPGAGKTTHAKRLEAERAAVRLCPDEWIIDLDLNLYDAVRRDRVEALQWSLARRLLMLGLTVVIEWGTWGRTERERLRADAAGRGAAVELHCLTAPVDALIRRVAARGMEDPPVKADDLRRWAGMFEVPTADEAAAYDAYVRIDASS